MSKTMFEWKETARGFARATFEDFYKQKCSIQKSSLADVDAIWLGVDVDLKGDAGARMHLDIEQARELIGVLTCFVEAGEINASGNGG